MGLDILTAELQNLRKNQAAANNVGFLLNIANLLCLDEFLAFLAQHITVLTAFKNMLNAMIATAAAQIALLNVVVAELEAANTILETFINIFKSALTAAQSKLQLFPFNNPNFIQCPPVQFIESAIASVLPSPSSAFAKLYKQSLADINEMQYRLILNGKQIQQLTQKIAQLQAQVLAWQAIVNAIAAQFHA